ncbi:MAG: hypothetical protein ED557_02810 [Balneola sp.]|nr:MAG: hypothetical protein ED557_02810 [Balneola sp.]
MKSLKLTLSVFMLVAFASVNTFAQEEATVTATAEIQAALTISADQNIDLGTIQTGTSSTLAAGPDDGTTEVNVGTSTSYGIVRMTGTASGTVTLSFSDAILTQSGSDPLDFVTVGYDSASQASHTSGSTLNFDASGNLTLYLGGTLDAAAGSGTYSTSGGGTASPITVTIQY